MFGFCPFDGSSYPMYRGITNLKPPLHLLPSIVSDSSSLNIKSICTTPGHFSILCQNSHSCVIFDAVTTEHTNIEKNLLEILFTPSLEEDLKNDFEYYSGESLLAFRCKSPIIYHCFVRLDSIKSLFYFVFQKNGNINIWKFHHETFCWKSFDSYNILKNFTDSDKSNIFQVILCPCFSHIYFFEKNKDEMTKLHHIQFSLKNDKFYVKKINNPIGFSIFDVKDVFIAKGGVFFILSTKHKISNTSLYFWRCGSFSPILVDFVLNDTEKYLFTIHVNSKQLLIFALTVGELYVLKEDAETIKIKKLCKISDSRISNDCLNCFILSFYHIIIFFCSNFSLFFSIFGGTLIQENDTSNTFLNNTLVGGFHYGLGGVGVYSTSNIYIIKPLISIAKQLISLSKISHINILHSSKICDFWGGNLSRYCFYIIYSFRYKIKFAIDYALHPSNNGKIQSDDWIKILFPPGFSSSPLLSIIFSSHPNLEKQSIIHLQKFVSTYHSLNQFLSQDSSDIQHDSDDPFLNVYIHLADYASLSIALLPPFEAYLSILKELYDNNNFFLDSKPLSLKNKDLLCMQQEIDFNDRIHFYSKLSFLTRDCADGSQKAMVLLEKLFCGNKNIIDKWKILIGNEKLSEISSKTPFFDLLCKLFYSEKPLLLINLIDHIISEYSSSESINIVERCLHVLPNFDISTNSLKNTIFKEKVECQCYLLCLCSKYDEAVQLYCHFDFFELAYILVLEKTRLDSQERGECFYILLKYWISNNINDKNLCKTQWSKLVDLIPVKFQIFNFLHILGGMFDKSACFNSTHTNISPITSFQDNKSIPFSKIREPLAYFLEKMKSNSFLT